ncbi:hypothetical protein VPNG_04402 [Cytospora leucostoma]|uniref:NACHT domain-containing protein n=1 Tax=Cytospora leucostoma TaxID=1230097 RepID=A0A423XBR9_9PEZI|nr:hypothetical protein VPNG_04402 [Cytospora leucostoma]
MLPPLRADTQLFAIGSIISFLEYSWYLTEYPWNTDEASRVGLGPRLKVHDVLNKLTWYLPRFEARYAKPDGSSIHADGLDTLVERCRVLARELVRGFSKVVEGGTTVNETELVAQQRWAMLSRRLDAAGLKARIDRIARNLGGWLVVVVRSEDWEPNIKLKELTKEAESVSSVRAEQITRLSRGVRMALGLPTKEATVKDKGQPMSRALDSSEDSGQESQPKRRIKTRRRQRPNAKPKPTADYGSIEGLPNWFCQVKDNIIVLDELMHEMPIELRILKFVTYDSMDSREDSIQDAEGNTFDWMLDDTSSSAIEPQLVQARESFIRWLNSGQGVFHISGKAGAGKSTLFKLLCHHRRTQAELQDWAGEDELVVASFFFWNSGNPLQTSLEGLFRSILVQVSRQCPNLMPDLFPDAWALLSESRTSGSHVPDEALWGDNAIMQAWNNLRDLESDQYSMCFFIDGLDEYTQTEDGPSYEEFANHFQKWAERNGDVKFCVSSRPYHDFLNAFSPDQRLHLHDLTHRDIKAFADASFGSPQDARYRGITAILVSTITVRSEGVFVWVRTAVRSLLALMKRGVEPEAVLNESTGYPSDIYALYGYLLRSLKPEEQSEAMHMIRIIIGNPFSQPPNALWLSWIDELYDRNFPDPSGSRPYTAGEVSKRHDAVQGKLECLARGMLTMFTDRREPKNGDQFYRQRVQFFHRTARDFFRKPLASDYAGNDTDSVGILPVGEDALTETFLRLRLAEIVLAGKYRAAPGADPRRRRLYFNYMRSLFGLRDGSGDTFQIPAKYLDILRKDLQTTHEEKFGSAYAVSGSLSISKPNVMSEDPETPASFLHFVLAYGQYEYALEELRRRGATDEGPSDAEHKGNGRGTGQSLTERELNLLLSAAFGGTTSSRTPLGAFEALLPFAGSPLAMVTLRPPVSNDFLASVSRGASVLLVFASTLVFYCQRWGGIGEGVGRREVQNIQRVLAMLVSTVRFLMDSGLSRSGADGSPTDLILVLKPKMATGIAGRRPSHTTAVSPIGTSASGLSSSAPTYYTTLKAVATAFGGAEDAVEVFNPNQDTDGDAHRVFVRGSSLKEFLCTQVAHSDGTSIAVEDDLCFRIY